MSKDYNLLRLLVVLYETRQTVTAAKKLNVSQPTVSLMLKKLREQFNDELFVRDGNRFEPTAKCIDLVEKVPFILDQLDELYTNDQQWQIEQMRGEVTLFFPPTLMAPVAAPLIAKLTLLAPGLTVNCQPWSPMSLHDLANHRAYWGVSYLPMETNKNVVQKSLPDDRFMLVTRRGHPLTINDLQEVLKYPLCVSVIPGYIEASKVEMLIKKYKLEKNVNVRSSDMSMMLELIKQSDAIGVMSEKNGPLLNDQFQTYPLPEVLYQDTFRRQAAFFCHLRDRHSPFTEWLYREVKSLFDASDKVL